MIQKHLRTTASALCESLAAFFPETCDHKIGFYLHRPRPPQTPAPSFKSPYRKRPAICTTAPSRHLYAATFPIKAYDFTVNLDSQTAYCRVIEVVPIASSFVTSSDLHSKIMKYGRSRSFTFGVAETVIMKIAGHRTRSVFGRYNITDHADTLEAGRKAEEFLATEQKRVAQSTSQKA